MSVLEIKQGLSRLSSRERKEVLIYLQQLRRATPTWRKATAKSIRAAKAGKVTTIDELEVRFRRG